MKSSKPSTNVWDYKPWWCQPWSILLTAFAMMGGSWMLFHLIWLTVVIAIPVLVWVSYFLMIYPQQVAQYLASYSELSYQNPSQGLDSESDASGQTQS
jgi:membrane protein YdbS with pleckstrin-like domain